MRYTLEQARRLPDETDWARVDAMSDEEIEAAAAADPDYAEFMDVDWSKAQIVHPRKKQPLSIRLDADIVEFFKAQGDGYQTRINAVLRHFIEHQSGKAK